MALGNKTGMEMTGLLVATIVIICLGSLQFGYHMAELNSPESILSCRNNVPGSVPYEESWFGRHGYAQCVPLTPQEVGMITSLFSIGGLVGSLYAGNLSDKYGRHKMSIVHCVLYFVGSMINGTSGSYFGLMMGRFISGLGAGAALVTTPIFINEIAPPRFRGFLGSMNQVSVNVGILITQVLALKWCDNNSWRILLLVGALIALVNLLMLIVYVDESPMWLALRGEKDQAFKILHGLRGGEYALARNEVSGWTGSELSQPEESTLLEAEIETPPTPAHTIGANDQENVSLEKYLRSSEYNNSKVVGTGILVLQQFCGINSIIFYGVSTLVQIFPTYAILINCLISIVNVVVTFGAAPLVDKLGRRFLLKTSSTMMSILSSLMGIGIIASSSIFSIIGTFTYITFFAIGLGPIPFLLVSEVTQPEAKGVAQSWGITMNWLATFIVGYLFPILKNSWMGGGTYFVFSFMCVVTYFFVQYWVPETKGAQSYQELWSSFERR